MAHDNAEALNRFLDDLTYGPAVPEDDVDPEIIATVRWFGDLGTEPRPDPEFFNRLEQDLMNKLALAPATGLPASGPTPFPTSRNQRRLTWPATPFSARFPHQLWANAGLAAILLLALLGVAYLAFGPLRPDPERPHQIPAAVGPSATPSMAEPTSTPMPMNVPPTIHPPIETPVPATATPFPVSSIGHPIAGAWHWAHADEYNNVVFNLDGSYLEYSPDYGIGLGSWRQTGERTAEIVIVYQTPAESLTREEVFAPDYVSTGHTFQPGVLILRLTAEVDVSSQTMTATGTFEERDAAGILISSAEIEPWYATRVGAPMIAAGNAQSGLLIVLIRGENGTTAIGGACLDITGSGDISICDDGDGDADPNPGIIEVDALPGGVYTVIVLPPEGYEASGDGQPLVVLPGELSSLYITLHPIDGVTVEPTVAMPPTPPTAHGDVSIQVIADDGTPVGGTCLELIGSTATYSVCDDGETDVDPTPGVVELIGLPAGDYNVTLVPPGGYEPSDGTGWATVTIHPSEIAMLTITLRPVGSEVAGPTATAPPPPMPTATPVT